ncbi:MAG: nuclear transport factor 2 family protein [Deltaproteobacteria bacterium]|nr:nuclear transport factor 2 family protein [Deltaproteobacteria bacterium]
MTTGLTHAERFDDKGRTAAEKRNVATVRAIFEKLSQGDFSGLFLNLAPGGSFWICGFTPERLPAKARDPNFFPDLFCNGMHFDIKQVAVDGDTIVVEWIDDAVTKDGKKYENTGCNWFTFNDEGKIINYREYIDPEKFFAVL